MKSFFIDSLKGIALGAGAILPGISSGVLCVIFGIYEKLLDSILYFFKDIKKNFRFLLPIFIGIFVGVLIFSNFLQYFLITFPIQTNSIFIGLILGTIPSLLETLKKEDNTSKLTIKKNPIIKPSTNTPSPENKLEINPNIFCGIVVVMFVAKSSSEARASCFIFSKSIKLELSKLLNKSKLHVLTVSNTSGIMRANSRTWSIKSGISVTKTRKITKNISK